MGKNLFFVISLWHLISFQALQKANLKQSLYSFPLLYAIIRKKNSKEIHLHTFHKQQKGNHTKAMHLPEIFDF